MKMIRQEAQALVMFDKKRVSPVFLTYSEGMMKVDRIMKRWKERRNFRECMMYVCQVDGREEPVELRWEIESNTWFIEKL